MYINELKRLIKKILMKNIEYIDESMMNDWIKCKIQNGD